MTYPNGNIVFNADTGSDTQASGLGPAVAVYGSAGIVTNGSPIVTGISTANVTAGDLLWIKTSSGIQYSFIASVDGSDQVTCDDNFTVDETGLTWAIGGKRATLDHVDSRKIFDLLGIFTVIELETDQTLTSTISASGANVATCQIKIKGNNYTIKSDGNFNAITGSQYKTLAFYNVKFDCVAGNTATALVSGSFACFYCQFGERGSDTNFNTAVNAGNYGSSMYVFRSKLYGLGAASTGRGGTAGHYASQILAFVECGIYDFGYASYSNTTKMYFNNCVVSDCGYGMYSTLWPGKCYSTVFYNITNDAWYIQTPHQYITGPQYFLSIETGNSDYPMMIEDNIFMNVGGYLFNNNSSYPASYLDVTTNAPKSYKYNCPNNDVGLETDVITLTADPFIDAENGDFNLNNVAGGGAVLRAAQYTL